jgi:neutral ceramidase
MKRKILRLALLSTTLIAPLAVAAAVMAPAITTAQSARASAPASGALLAGAARVDITPAVEDLPKPFESIESRLYVRTVVLDSGGKRAVLVVGDLPMFAPDIFDDVMARISKEAGTPPENIMLAVTHTHDTVRMDNNPVGIILPGSEKITRITTAAILASVKQAIANRQPAKAGYANGVFRLAGRSDDGAGAEGAAVSGRIQSTDASIGVFKVENMRGEPIALMVSNGPGPGVPGLGGGGKRSKVSADMVGMVERYVEQRYGDKVVAMYTVGAPMGIAMNPGRKGPGIVPPEPNTVKGAVATVLGEEVIATALRIKTSEELTISGSLEVLMCPGKSTSPLNNSSSCSDAPGSKLPRCVFTDTDIAPAPLRFGTIQLSDFMIVHSDANVMPSLWAKVKNGAPKPANTMLVSLGYGPVHYVVPDEDYPSNSYPVTASMVKRGCAATGFVNGALKMVNRSRAPGK